jgi:uncharacterized membrane protein
MAVPQEIGDRAQRVIRTFVAGVIGILPLALTLAVLGWLVKFLHDLAGPGSMCGRMLRSIGMSVVACDVTAYIIGLVGALLAIYGLGVLIENGIGRHWSRAMDDALLHVPVIGTVYDASKQMTSMFDRNQDAKKKSMTPVLCFLGGQGGVATPALMPTPELVRLGDAEYHVVMIPTAPVPFGGALLCVKAEWVQPANCGFDELVGIYMSMGVTAPRSLGSNAAMASNGGGPGAATQSGS